MGKLSKKFRYIFVGQITIVSYLSKSYEVHQHSYVALLLSIKTMLTVSQYIILIHVYYACLYLFCNALKVSKKVSCWTIQEPLCNSNLHDLNWNQSPFSATPLTLTQSNQDSLPPQPQVSHITVSVVWILPII